MRNLIIVGMLVWAGCAINRAEVAQHGITVRVRKTRSVFRQEPKVFKSWGLPGLARDGGTLTINEGNRAQIDEDCADDGGTHDDGGAVNFARRPIACVSGEGDEISYLRGYACAIAHELCHISGLPGAVCGKAYDVDDFCRWHKSFD